MFLARPTRPGGREKSVPPACGIGLSDLFSRPQAEADTAGGTDHGFVHRSSAGRHGPHADRPQHDRLPALQRPARRSGAADLRQGLHPRSHRGQPARLGLDKPLYEQYAAFVKGIFVGRTYGYGTATVRVQRACLGYSFRKSEEVTDLITTAFR